MRGEEFEGLYAEHAQSLFGFFNYRTGDRPLSEDLLADTFEKAFRARRRFNRLRGSEKTWLYSIALNCLRDHQRRTRVREKTLESATAALQGGGHDAGLDRVEDRDELGPALAALSVEEREAVALRYGADLSVPEVAKLLGEPLSRVEGRVYRAVRKLREELS